MIKFHTVTRLRQDTGQIRWECTGKYGSVLGYRTPWRAWRTYMRLRKGMRKAEKESPSWNAEK